MLVQRGLSLSGSQRLSNWRTALTFSFFQVLGYSMGQVSLSPCLVGSHELYAFEGILLCDQVLMGEKTAALTSAVHMQAIFTSGWHSPCPGIYSSLKMCWEVTHSEMSASEPPITCLKYRPKDPLQAQEHAFNQVAFRLGVRVESDSPSPRLMLAWAGALECTILNLNQHTE